LTFLDTSLLVRMYVREVGSEAVCSLRGREVLVLSRLAEVEFPWALARRRREGALEEGQVATLLALFEEDREGFLRIPVEAEVIRRAGELVGRHPLHPLAAVHLASALVADEGSPEVLLFGSADEGLREAASAEGLGLLPVA
jgi:predicted nucleic acid-binding protein